MKRDTFRIYSIDCLLVVALIVLSFLPIGFSSLICPVLLCGFAWITKSFFRKKGQVYSYQKKIIVLIFLLSIIHIIGYYGSGIFLGFVKNSSQQSFLFLLIGMISLYLIEKIRFSFLMQEKKGIPLLTLIAFLLADFILYRGIGFTSYFII